MPSSQASKPAFVNLLLLLTALTLASCGGGGGDGGAAPAASGSSAASAQLALEPNAPQETGDTATDGVNWFNYRRQQAGLAAVSRTASIDAAAQAHSTYQKLNDTITHDETAGKPGFTGVTLPDRLSAAGYTFTQRQYSYGEVISATGSTSGFSAAEDLITAIYHRFVIMEPKFKEVGGGFDTVSGGYTYFTTDFASNGLSGGLGAGKIISYPFSNQQHVPVDFFSDRETPDPIPNQNQVGYPVSVHADITSTILVQSFTLKERGGAAVAVKLLTHSADTETPPSAAAIIPLNVLTAQTTYDAQFIGTIDGVPLTLSWSFMTR